LWPTCLLTAALGLEQQCSINNTVFIQITDTKTMYIRTADNITAIEAVTAQI